MNSKRITQFAIILIIVAGIYWAATTAFGAFGVTTSGLENGLVGHWTFDGPDMLTNVADTSGNENNGDLTLGASGNTSTTTVAGSISQALVFDGTDDYISVGNTGSTIKTVSFWIQANDTTSRKIIDMNGTAQVELDASSAVTATSFPAATVYVDGVVASTIDTGWHLVTITDSTGVSASALDIGRVSTGYFNGSLDDVRIYNRALSANEVQSLYNFSHSTFAKTPTDAFASNLVGHWTFDGPDMTSNVADTSGSGNNGYISGQTSTTTILGVLGQALKFDGTDDVVIIPDPAGGQLDFGANQEFSITMWVRADLPYNQLGTGSFLIDKRGGAGYQLRDNGAGIFMRIDEGSTNTDTSTSYTSTITDGGWHLIVIGRSATQHFFYVDDNAPDTTSDSTLADLSNTIDFYFGRDQGGFVWWKGDIDDLRVYDRALSATEINQLYHLGAAKFGITPKASGLENGLVGHWTFDGSDMTSNVADTSGSGNNGRIFGQTSTTTIIGKLGQALEFDGSNDYVGGFSSDPPTGPASFAVWIKPDAVSGTYDIVGKLSNWTHAYGYGLLIAASNVIGIADSGYNGWNSNLATPITANVWSHVVFTLDGWGSNTTGKLYVNGVLKNTFTGTAGYYAPYSFYIGACTTAAARLFNGAIDDVRIYNRELSATEVNQLYNLGR